MISLIVAIIIIYFILGLFYSSVVTLKYKKDALALEREEFRKKFLLLTVGWIYYFFLDCTDYFIGLLLR